MELVARAFFEFFQNIRGILFVMVVVFLPVVLLDSVILTRLNAINSFLSTVQAAGTFLENREGIMQAMNHTIIGSVLSMAIELFLVPVGTIAIAKIVKQRIDGEEPDVKTALKEALALGPTIILTGLIYGVLVTLGMIVLIPGIWYSVFAGLYVYCIGLDENGKIDPAKLDPIVFDPVNHAYLKLGEKVGDAFKDGMKLK